MKIRHIEIFSHFLIYSSFGFKAVRQSKQAILLLNVQAVAVAGLHVSGRQAEQVIV